MTRGLFVLLLRTKCHYKGYTWALECTMLLIRGKTYMLQVERSGFEALALALVLELGSGVISALISALQ